MADKQEIGVNICVDARLPNGKIVPKEIGTIYPNKPWPYNSKEFINGCLVVNEQPAQATAIPAQVASSFRSLKIPKPVIETEPGADPILQVPVNLIAQAKPVSRTTTLLGTKLQIKAQPVSYRWEITDLTTGKIDGEPIETNEAGQYYHIDQKVIVGHTFHYPGPYRIALTATYKGQYALAGSSQWNDIPGTVTTSATPTTITAVEYRNYLTGEPDEQR